MRHVSHCPHCKSLLDGKDIYQCFFDDYQDKAKALDYASSYGWTKERPTCFSRLIGVYDMEQDRTTHYECPDCKEKISRKVGELA